MRSFVASIDQGTTSTRCMIFDHGGTPVALAQEEHRQIYLRPGWVEHRPLEIWERAQQVAKAALAKAKLRGSDLAAIGITNQRETTIVWNKHTGEPYCNALVWQDTRTKEVCDRLAADGGLDRFRSITGLPKKGIIGFGSDTVNGLSLVPDPPAIITPFITF